MSVILASTALVALFVSLAVLLIFVILFILFFPKINKKRYQKDFVKIYGKKVYRYALHNDLYLINQLELKGNDDQLLKIDHLLFGNKYIYLISDYYLPGVVEAKENDNSFLYTSNEKNAKKVYIDNLLKKNADLTRRVADNLGLKANLFIPISIVDNSCDLLDFKPEAKNNFIVHIASINKLLDALEARKVAPLNDEQLRYTVKDVNRLNVRRKEI